MSNRIFVVNEPLKDNGRGRAIDLRPAQAFGEVIFLVPAGEPPLDPEGWLPRMRELLATYRPGDFLVPVGHPATIAAAGALAAAANGGCFTVLVWRGREEGGYAPMNINLFQQSEEKVA